MSLRKERPEVATIRTEHAALSREIADWRAWWQELSELGQPHFGEMGNRLAQFRAHLVTHMQHEEALLSEAPEEIAKELPRLREGHAGLLSELDRLIERLQACEPDFDCWGAAREEFERFLDQMQAHESAEVDLFERIS